MNEEIIQKILKELQTPIYIFDIDVLDRNNIVFDIGTIDETLERLRDIKNNIFFGNLTNKILELCN